MAYAVIELLTLNLALTPPFRQTLVAVAQRGIFLVVLHNLYIIYYLYQYIAVSFRFVIWYLVALLIKT